LPKLDLLILKDTKVAPTARSIGVHLRGRFLFAFFNLATKAIIYILMKVKWSIFTSKRPLA